MEVFLSRDILTGIQLPERRADGSCSLEVTFEKQFYLWMESSSVAMETARGKRKRKGWREQRKGEGRVNSGDCRRGDDGVH